MIKMKCFICGKKIGLLSAKAKTSDSEWLCIDDMNKLFGETTGKEHVGIKPAYSSWVQKHDSSEIQDLIDNGKTAIPEGPDRCIGCGKKVPFKFCVTKDNKRVCPDCVKKVFDNYSATTKDWVMHHDALYFLGYFKQGLKLKVRSKDEAEGEYLFCPYCFSKNVQPLGQHRKGFSVGKAVGGAVLTGGVGAVAGFLGKNTKQTDFVCMDCGKQFKK
ncbi:hypothetical protein [Limosilactobacillus pontis]|uniref:hypothetical protein n=1 Tax=Limosilactobacillus pontis TaxID=35787 RepID=UPI002F26BC33